MYTRFVNDYRGFKDFNVVQCGARRCEPGFTVKCFQPRESHIIHYIYEGEGYFETKYCHMPLGKNQAFLVYPGQIAIYASSVEKPLLYRWVAFYGEKTEEFLSKTAFSHETPIISDSSPYKAGKILRDIIDVRTTSPYELISKFYAFIGALSSREDTRDSGSRYVDTALNYINLNRSARLTVNELAASVNLSRSFFSRLFTAQVGVSPKKYLLDDIMTSAEEMVKNSSLSIGEISEILKYENPVDFTRAFKRYFGDAPTKYRSREALTQK